MKGTTESGGVGGGRGSRERQERELLYEQCLNAPTPIRYLTPKQRAREVEREKMGLISKWLGNASIASFFNLNKLEQHGVILKQHFQEQ